MGTRLLSEQRIKDRFPHLRYIRIHTDDKHSATIYAWNEDLQLTDKEMRCLRQFASEYLQSHICFKIKAYNMIQADHVPHIQELPESIIKTAMNRQLNQYGIVAAINSLFSPGRLNYARYDSIRGTIHFDFQTIMPISHQNKELLSSYLSEMIPIGSNCEVNFY
jgi:hypothetical protein